MEAPDSDGRPDKVLADIWWNNHLMRELSIIVALFTGQYKSLLTCSICKYASARFEPFCFMQLPLPEDDQLTVPLLFFPYNNEETAMKYSIRVKNDGTLLDLLINLSKVIHNDQIGSKKNIDVDDIASTSSSVGDQKKVEGADSIDDDSKTDDDPNYYMYAQMARNMSTVKKEQGCIKHILPVSFYIFQ